MKRLIFIYFFPFIFGCASEIPPYKAADLQRQQQTVLLPSAYEGEIEDKVPVREFSYRGHNFLVFSGGREQFGVHDPDCSCFQHSQVEKQ